MRRDRPARANKTRRGYADVGKIATQNCLQIRTATDIPIADDEDAAHLAQIQDGAPSDREAPAA